MRKIADPAEPLRGLSISARRRAFRFPRAHRDLAGAASATGIQRCAVLVLQSFLLRSKICENYLF